MLFKKHHVKKILEGRKTQTRRTGSRKYRVRRCYGIRCQWFQKSIANIIIRRRFEQKLGEISLEDIKKEGYQNIWEFCRAWEEINGPGSWDPEQLVTVYEFELVRSPGFHPGRDLNP